ncbi:BREX-1 system adenine-specific DNA-methyltransferase PglX [Acinetobacter towneri]|uniref:BREX-1 system adenine-specific DNA-methyltransferase PglX n=1 Tax=Acinetobacter towneri TaxID=202956 RepID=UPI0039899375
MNTAKLKKYAPQARREFITAVSKQLNQLGIYSDKQISEAKQEGSVLLIEGKTFEPSVKTARERLVKKVQAMGYNQLVEQVAYTWFNRLCAIRYMEIHDYLGHGFRVLSHPDNPKGFEIIDHAQDAADELGLDRARIIELKLAGNKDEELYRELLLGQCHKLHEAMPFLFDALDDETELLLPDNLTRTDSILRGLVDGIPEEDWQQVEVIGWLYQFYISEKKDQVMGKVVKSEDIPAATQLFTPNWIVKYLVQNSVGRQWLQTYPRSGILDRLREIDKKKKQETALIRGEANIESIEGEVFYIHPAEQSEEVNQQLRAITPESIDPETIKILDPACGSGHILIEAYNVLKAIYEERGFRSRDIPKMILENNLYGLDIDDRAAQLSGFALMMMARDDDKHIFTRNVRLNVLALQESNHLNLQRLWNALNLSGNWQIGTSQGLFDEEEQDLSSFNADNRYQLLKRTLARFTRAKTFGSLIDVPSDEHEQLKELMSTLVELQESGDSMQKPAAKQLIEIVHQALVLSIRYDAVIANPPYMGSKGMNFDLKEFSKKDYPDSKTDLFSIYIERCVFLGKQNSKIGMVTPYVWMFIGTYERLREKIVSNHAINSLIQLEYNAFAPACIPVCSFIIAKSYPSDLSGVFIRLSDFKGHENQAPKTLEAIRNPACGWLYNARPDSFKRIPGTPIAYWVSEKVVSSFDSKRINDISDFTGSQNITADNEKFLRYWHEVDYNKFGNKWVGYFKGGKYRKYYGNQEWVVDWSESARDFYKNNKTSNLLNENYWFREGITYTDITSGGFAARYMPEGFIYDKAGPAFHLKGNVNKYAVLSYLNSNFVSGLIQTLNPTLHCQVKDMKSIPVDVLNSNLELAELGRFLVEEIKNDWDRFECSWSFEYPDAIKFAEKTVEDTFSCLFRRYEEITQSILEKDKDVNRIISDFYDLEGEADYHVPINKVTVNINPYYRYRVEDDLELRKSEIYGRLYSDTICELISYAVGCMMGRYSLDIEGLVYAHAGNDGFDKLVAEGTYKTFPADEDGIIPLTDQEWFKDDVTNRFREFVQVVWGEEHLQENLDYVAESLCLNAIKSKKSESALETIRRYLSTQFYKDHLKTYKKRPIYWLFSSGKHKAFECLVYLHRYNEGTLSRMRTEYVTPLLGKYDAYAEQLEKQIETADSTSEANRFKKELDALIKKQVELREFDDKLKHYADMRISLDLDDGVKVNYGKFGDLLADVKAITGSAPEDN